MGKILSPTLLNVLYLSLTSQILPSNLTMLFSSFNVQCNVSVFLTPYAMCVLVDSMTTIIIVCMVCTVFKILKLGTDQIEIQNDFRDLPHKQLNLNYSSNDVQWNPKDGMKNKTMFRAPIMCSSLKIESLSCVRSLC